MQPHITMGAELPARASSSATSSVASTPSRTAEARNEHVLITTASAEATSSASSMPAARSRARMRSVSTSFFAQPSVSSATRGAPSLAIVDVLEW